MHKHRYMKKIVKLTESDLHKIIENILREGESGGWVVEPDEAQDAYNLAASELGNDELNAAIVRSMGDNALAQCLAYVFRMYDFRKWDEYKSRNDYERSMM